jgi:hypothetical protein
LQRELDGIAPPPPEPESFEAPEDDRDAPEPSPPEKSADEPPLPFEPESRPDFTPPAEPESPPEPTPPSRKPFSTEHPSLVDEGLKGFRDVIAETDDLGGATASASKSARETRDAFSALPPSSEIERIEPRLDPRIGKRIDPQDLTPQDLRPSGPEFRLPSPRPPPQRPESRTGVRPRPITPPPAPPELDELEEQELRSGLGGGARKIIALAVILVLAAAAFFAYREWGSSVTGLFQSARGPATQASKEAPQARPKISDRIGGAQQDQAARPSAGAGAAVAQRAVLYEQQPSGQERKQYVGSVIWRTETVSPGPGQPPDIAIKADVEIPERHIRMSLTVRRNLDPSLPASHTIEILFSTPADFPPGGIADLAGVVMEDAEQSRGVPLAGTRVKVTNGFFLVGLSSVEGDVRRNVQSLKDRAWMHIRMAYNDGQRALLAIEKGVPGDRVFEDAFNAWNQAPPAAQR